MTLANKDRIRALLKSIETGDPGPVTYVNEARYIQHNPQTEEGSEGLAELFKRLSRTNPKVNIVRAFEDGDYVFAHTEYDFANRNIGFEVFRFEAGQAVEHWDNIQRRKGPNASNHSMVDGPTEAVDRHLTEENRALVRAYAETVLIAGDVTRLQDFVDAHTFVEHSPSGADGIAALQPVLVDDTTVYTRTHRILAEGSFVLSVSEGLLGGAPAALYDLFRINQGKIVEHWDTVEKIAPQSEWKNDNGKF